MNSSGKSFTCILMIAVALAALAPTRGFASGPTIQQQLEGPVHYWLTGSSGEPTVQEIESFAVFGSYAYVNWTSAGGNSGGQMLLKRSAPGAWHGVFSSGGAFRYKELVARGVPSKVASFFTTETNFAKAVHDLPSQTPTAARSPRMAPSAKFQPYLNEKISIGIGAVAGRARNFKAVRKCAVRAHEERARSIVTSGLLDAPGKRLI